jgi:hypothetical protein
VTCSIDGNVFDFSTALSRGPQSWTASKVLVLFPLLKTLVDLAKSAYKLFVGRTGWLMLDERIWILLFKAATMMREFAIGAPVHENEFTVYSVALVRVLLCVVSPLTKRNPTI